MAEAKKEKEPSLKEMIDDAEAAGATRALVKALRAIAAKLEK